jgi:hypothetical protein
MPCGAATTAQSLSFFAQWSSVVCDFMSCLRADRAH